MIRNALIAIYILAVLAFSAVARADQALTLGIEVKPKRTVNPTIYTPRTADPLPGTGVVGHGTKMLSIGNRGVNK